MKQFTQAVMLSALVTLANSQPTNSAVDETPAADTDVGSSTSFLPCSTTTNVTAEDADTSPRGYVSYALCYYAVCEVLEDSNELWPWSDENNTVGTGRCGCIAWHGSNLVDMYGILNATLYDETLAACPNGTDTEGCDTTNAAPICDNVNNPATMFDPALLHDGPPDLISDFSLAFAGDKTGVYGYEFGQTDCPIGKYAACMTAPCYNKPITIDGVVYPITCACPVVEGVYTVGQADAECDLGDNLVWSSAFTKGTVRDDLFTEIGFTPTGPNVTDSDGVCLPDAPGLFGCPLYEQSVFCTVDIPENVTELCPMACEAASQCVDPQDGVQATFYCDATTCTSPESATLIECSQRLTASNCSMGVILEVEAIMGCSCCFEKVCGCVPSQTTINYLRRTAEAVEGFTDPLSCPIISPFRPQEENDDDDDDDQDDDESDGRQPLPIPPTTNEEDSSATQQLESSTAEEMISATTEDLFPDVQETLSISPPASEESSASQEIESSTAGETISATTEDLPTDTDEGLSETSTVSSASEDLSTESTAELLSDLITEVDTSTDAFVLETVTESESA